MRLKLNQYDQQLATMLDDRQFTVYLQALAERLGIDLSTLVVGEDNEIMFQMVQGGMLACLQATLLYYHKKWDADAMEKWIELLGTQDSTSFALCEAIRKMLYKDALDAT